MDCDMFQDPPIPLPFPSTDQIRIDKLLFDLVPISLSNQTINNELSTYQDKTQQNTQFKITESKDSCISEQFSENTLDNSSSTLPSNMDSREYTLRQQIISPIHPFLKQQVLNKFADRKKKYKKNSHPMRKTMWREIVNKLFKHIQNSAHAKLLKSIIRNFKVSETNRRNLRHESQINYSSKNLVEILYLLKVSLGSRDVLMILLDLHSEMELFCSNIAVNEESEGLIMRETHYAFHLLKQIKDFVSKE